MSKRFFLAASLAAISLGVHAEPRVTVTDGDTLRVDGRRVRLAGIDALELA